MGEPVRPMRGLESRTKVVKLSFLIALQSQGATWLLVIRERDVQLFKMKRKIRFFAVRISPSIC